MKEISVWNAIEQSTYNRESIVIVRMPPAEPSSFIEPPLEISTSEAGISQPQMKTPDSWIVDSLALASKRNPGLSHRIAQIIASYRSIQRIVLTIISVFSSVESSSNWAVG